MFAVTVRIEVAPDRMAEFMPLMLENARASLAEEPACHRFDVCSDPGTPEVVFLYELYEDEAGFDTHRTMPHYLSFDAAVSPMIRVKDVATWSLVQG